MYNDKSTTINNFIKYINKNIYFCNVIYFVKRIKNIIKIKKVELMQQNLYICFRNIVLTWYIIIFIENKKRFVKLNIDIDK